MGGNGTNWLVVGGIGLAAVVVVFLLVRGTTSTGAQNSALAGATTSPSQSTQTGTANQTPSALITSGNSTPNGLYSMTATLNASDAAAISAYLQQMNALGSAAVPTVQPVSGG